jgi:hypothetical protein
MPLPIKGAKVYNYSKILVPYSFKIFSIQTNYCLSLVTNTNYYYNVRK